MYKKSNLLLIVAILCFSFSCKSESKEKKAVATPTIEVLEEDIPYPVKEEINIEPKNEVVEKVIKSTKPESAKPNATNNVKKDTDKNITEPSSEVETKIKPSETPKNTPKVTKSKTTTQVKDIEEVVTEIEETIPTKTTVTETSVIETKPEKTTKEILPPNHKVFDTLLKSHVNRSGKVNYEGFNNDITKFESYLSELENTDISLLSRNEKLAFWINAYNAYTIKLILDNYPVKSITDLHGGKPWDHKWIKINGKTLSLNNIENDIIRPTFNEPRIHFAVNCAAKSCPPLLNAAYTSKSLESQLESQTKKFINNSEFNTLGKDQIMVSKIFDWYGVDFGDIASYILRYSDTTVKPSAKVAYNEYDWALNN